MKLSCFFVFIAAIISDDSNAQSVDLENWMHNLPQQLRDFPIIYLAIPGSHDSMTFGITRQSEIAPDAEPAVVKLYPLFRGTIRRWSKTQNLDTLQQLHAGIRYFDLRLSTKNGSDKLYFSHGLYAGEITKPLQDIKMFLESHPNEVVILDFQHFYGFTFIDHQTLTSFVMELYSTLIVPRQSDLTSITLNSLARLKQSVIMIYRSPLTQHTPDFWFNQMMPSPWPQQDTVDGLISFLRRVRRPPQMGFIHQAVLTPTPGYILFRFLIDILRMWISNLRDKCAIPVIKHVLPVIEQFTPGRPSGAETSAVPVNVVIADFIELNDTIFPKTIIQLNNKLLLNPPPY